MQDSFVSQEDTITIRQQNCSPLVFSLCAAQRIVNFFLNSEIHSALWLESTHLPPPNSLTAEQYIAWYLGHAMEMRNVTFNLQYSSFPSLISRLLYKTWGTSSSGHYLKETGNCYCILWRKSTPDAFHFETDLNSKTQSNRQIHSDFTIWYTTPPRHILLACEYPSFPVTVFPSSGLFNETSQTLVILPPPHPK